MTLKQLYNTLSPLWNGSPLPIHPSLAPIFQTWRKFNPSQDQWVTASPDHDLDLNLQEEQKNLRHHLQLLSWNVDAHLPFIKERMAQLLNMMLYDIPPVDVIFLQEVTREGWEVLMADERVRVGWVVGGCDEYDAVLSSSSSSSQGGGKGQRKGRRRKENFISVILLSKVRFRNSASIWLINLPSYSKETAALCCDIFLDPSSKHRVRLINCHFHPDSSSLPTSSSSSSSSLRPEQIEICASLIASSGKGALAGDFGGAVREEQEQEEEEGGLLEKNGMVDGWEALKSGEDDDGSTWKGENGETKRRSKVGLLKLVPREMRVWQPGFLEEGREGRVPWSDHSGISCTIALGED